MEKNYTYSDESGESSFSQKSHFKHFVFCALTVGENGNNKIKNILKRKRAELLGKGLPPEIELKANILNGIRKNAYIPGEVKNKIDGPEIIKELITKIVRVCSPRIDYITVNKDKITNNSLRNAPYGIAYNYFSGLILAPLCIELGEVALIIDQRNKELHHKKHFDGYLNTKILELCVEKDISRMDISILHGDSKIIPGLQAVDLFSWSIFRKFEYGDETFFNIFKHVIKSRREWWCD